MAWLQRGRQFWRDESGGIFIFGVLLLIAFFMIGGLAIDVANAYMNRTHLQVAADSAAHAALYTRDTKTAAEAKTVALTVANRTMPAERFGDILRAEDIQFGHWNDATQVFTPNASSRDAVMVDTARLADRSNQVATFFLRFANIDFWDVRRRAVFVTYRPTCFREGFVGEDIVDVQSGNTYKAGFCIHSQTHVEVNSNNMFEPGVIVSMPNKQDLVIPSSGMASNTGLQPALRDGSYQIRILNRVNAIIAGVQDPTSPHYRSFITDPLPVTLNRNAKLDQTVFLPGLIYKINCASEGQHAQIHTNTVLRNVVVVTNCLLKFGEGVGLEDAIVVNTNTREKSIDAASGVRIGRNDNCAVGGGAQIVTRGGVDIPAQLEMYGGQILAVGNVSFTSVANGMQGASIVSGGRIDGTSNSVMGFCGGAGMEQNFEAEYFKLVF